MFRFNSPGTLEILESRIAPATIFGVTDNNALFSFDSDTPGTIGAITPITGLSAGQLIKAMDFRPADGGLYAVALSGMGPYTGQLYTINPLNGAATAVGPAFSSMLTTAIGYDIDFNPTADRIRLVNADEENLRLSPLTGAIAQTDAGITGATSLTAAAYTNNYAGSTVTTLYGVDFITDDLVIIGGLNSSPSPNGGVATKVADINVTTAASDRLGLDILTTLEGNTAFYLGVVSAAPRIYTLDLATGAATVLGAIGNGMTAINDIAVQPLAPLAFADGKTFTYADGNGDTVTVKTTLGTLKSSQFSWLTSADGSRRELVGMNIAGDANFTGANLTFTATKTAAGGDGRVEIGYLNATGLNLGAVKIAGNLERITAGTGDLLVPAVKSLNALSVGKLAGGTDKSFPVSIITGDVPLLKIKGDLDGASVSITGKAGIVAIGGSVIGADADGSGRFDVMKGTKSFALGGSILGGAGTVSGVVVLSGQNGSVKVGGSVVGSTGYNSGLLSVANPGAPAASFTVGGSIVGGSGPGFSGRVTMGNVTTAKIGGSVIGGADSAGALLFGKVTSLTVNGSIAAGDGLASGIVSGLSAGKATVGGSVVGGAIGNSASIGIDTVGAFTLGGSLLGGEVAIGSSGFLHFGKATTVTIKGNVTGQQGSPAIIGFGGVGAPASAAASIAVSTLAIRGSVVNASILLGEGFTGFVSNVNTAAGKITVGGDFLASSISAGFSPGPDGFYGNDNDVVPTIDSAPAIKAAIGSIVINGRVSGTASDGDHYGITAESIGSIIIAGRKVALDPLAQDNLLVGSFGDFRVRERTIL
jgi:hypothetical protein